MNLFFLDESPYLAAEQYATKHLVKMPTEIANMLLWPFQLSSYSLPLTKEGKTRRLSHLNHPVSIWVRASIPNYDWTLNHLWALCRKYKESYGKVHDAERLWRFCQDAPRCLDFPQIDYLTPFPRCFSTFKADLDTTTPDTIEAYRKFYWLDKQEFARWTDVSEVPPWWPDDATKYVDKSFENGQYTKRKK